MQSLKIELKTEILNELRAGNSATQHKVSRGEILQCIRKDRERERRKLNLCITNIPESASNADESTIKNSIGDQLELQEGVYNKIKSVRRFGTHRDDQSLLTLLTLETSEARPSSAELF